MEMCVQANFNEKFAQRACTEVVEAVFAAIQKRQIKFRTAGDKL
jgi:hypothetical protein